MRQTIWKAAPLSLPDRGRSPNLQSAKKKGKSKAQEPPKSKEVSELELLAKALRRSTGKERDPEGGCFCLATQHPLSMYTPICRDCGLILCAVNQPHHSCPHCSSELLTAHARASLISQLEARISQTLAKEAAEQEEQARRAIEAFPALPGAPPASSPPPDSRSGTPKSGHTVLSLNSKTKAITISSYASPALPTRAEGKDEKPKRVPRPPVEVSHVKSTIDDDPTHAWRNLGDGRPAVYVHTSEVGEGDDQAAIKSSRRSRKAKGKGPG